MSLGMKKTIKKLLIGILVLGFLFSIKIQGAELKEEVIDIGNGVKLEMVLIPAGKFIMGSTKDREEAVLKEKFKNSGEEEARISKWAEDNAASLTQHEVTISKQFYMGKFEVTIEQWYAMSGGIKPDGYEKLYKKLPVRYVSKEKINSILAQFNKRTSDKLLAKFDKRDFNNKFLYRLPTEAEWEYACRAGTTTNYSFGDKITPKDANYLDSKIGEPVAVGSYKPNAFGLYDMHGNVSEWVQDYTREYTKNSVVDPKGLTLTDIAREDAFKKMRPTGMSSVIRGGNYSFSVWAARSAERDIYKPDRRSLGDSLSVSTIGFRIVGEILTHGETKINAKGPSGNKNVAELVEILRSGSGGEERAKAAVALGEIGPPALTELIKALREDGKSWRSWGGSAMSKMGPNVIRPLIQGLNDDNEYVRLAIVYALNEMGLLAIEAVPALQKTAQTDTDDRVRSMAKNAINQIRRK
jgi:formylglycine-generating enzyme required for sulfatase activity